MKDSVTEVIPVSGSFVKVNGSSGVIVETFSWCICIVRGMEVWCVSECDVVFGGSVGICTSIWVKVRLMTP